MHRHRIIAQICLILSVLNVVVASPIVVQKIHEARCDEMVVAEDVAAMPKKSRGLEMIAPDRSASLGSKSPPDAMATPQYSPSLDGSTSSDYLTPHLSPDSGSRLQESASSSGLSQTPPPQLPASLDEPASPHTSSSSSSEIPPYPPASLHESTSPYPSSSGSWRWQWSSTPSPHFPESLDEPASPHHSSAGSSEIPPYSAPTEMPPDNADSELFNKNMMKKLKIVGVLAIVGATVTSVVVPLMKHHKHRDRQDGSPWRFNKDRDTCVFKQCSSEERGSQTGS